MNSFCFQSAYNLSLENPLCPHCLTSSISSQESKLLGGSDSFSPLLFSADWFEKLTELYFHDIPYGRSASAVTNKPSSPLPSSINSLLTNPPLMIKLKEPNQLPCM